MPDLKLGKTPATYDKRDLVFEHYRFGALPPLPLEFGQEHLIGNWGMLGNDQFGDCVFAGAAHETMLWNAERGSSVTFSDEAVLSDYAAVTGFDPATGSGDNGTNMRDALNYRANTGVVDNYEQRHKIGAFVALEPGNYEHIEEAMFLFGAVAIGIQFPASAMDQFNAGQMWSYRPGSPIEGGHYVPLVGKHHNRVDCVTWGRTQYITRRFLAAYCDEAYAILSPEMLTSGRSIGGFDLGQLQADLQALKA